MPLEFVIIVFNFQPETCDAIRPAIVGGDESVNHCANRARLTQGRDQSLELAEP